MGIAKESDNNKPKMNLLIKNIDVKYIESIHNVPVLSNYLKINITKSYIQSVVPSLTDHEARRVIYWLAKMYDVEMGIAEQIRSIAKGVESTLL